VRAYAVLIGELLYIAINTVPQLSYSMTSLTLYMSKAIPAHLTYAKVVLRYLIGIKKRQLMWCGQRVCFIQKLIQNELINVKQCPTAAQTADIGTKALPRVLFENFTDQLLGDKHVGDKSALPKPRVCAFKFDLVRSGTRLSIVLSLSCYASAWLLIVGRLASEQGGNAHCFSNYDYLLFLSLFSTHAFRSYISHA